MSASPSQSDASSHAVGDDEDMSAHEVDISSQSSASSSSQASIYNPMEDLEGMSYSQEDTVRAFRDYYAFLAKMYVDESLIINPPSGGWPSITKERYRGMGKTDVVIELLRHLPYLDEFSGDFLAVQTAPYTTFWNFVLGCNGSGKEAESTKLYTEGPQFTDSIPAHVIGLSSGENDPLLFLLDTQFGVIYWIEAPGYVKDNDGSNPSFISPISNDPYDWAPEHEADWRHEPCWSVADFFTLLKQLCLQLKHVPLKPQQVVYVWASPSSWYMSLVPPVQDVYRQHGWPDVDNFRKEKCQAAIKALLAAREEAEDARE
ncbi:uncharacterized protein F5Z01DRAFT_660968 [Emericellopsis atlantica]|uniref:Uncharacterized protein n=1 Tax=Emericellopsis atlantica TaxID=2614577 RepID=A0A9P8CPA5_9HYPO|nr:uncharacterized protein F5Z01DRAFT_660968 [Emericellopsis atlantica]KAG9252571.1 hypothetical protein F5Z01DRAFT_660968 [Emericellopsis atlantica]